MPTPGRVRETLFNWLAPYVPGARVLDLFAGSGALGLEALSRGASSVMLVEQDSRHLAVLTENVRLCALPGAEMKATDAFQYLKTPARAFDLVFLDPPYGRDLIPQAVAALQTGWLADEAYIYVELEAARAADLPLYLPANWRVIKAKITGEVSYNLCERRMPV